MMQDGTYLMPSGKEEFLMRTLKSSRISLKLLKEVNSERNSLDGTIFLSSNKYSLSLFSIIVDPKYVGAGFTKLLNNLNIGSLVILLMVSPWKMYIAPVVVAIIFLAIAPMFAEEEKGKDTSFFTPFQWRLFFGLLGYF